MLLIAQTRNLKVSIIKLNSTQIGFGYVEFKFPESVPKALDLCGKDFKGRRLIVDYTETGPRKGYKIRLHDEGNKLYNKQIKREIAAKKRRKEKMRAKIEEGKDFA